MPRYFFCAVGLLLIINTAWCHPGGKKLAENETALECGGIIYADSGTVDYLFPEGQTYPANTVCIWTLRMDPRTHVHVIKTESDLQLGVDVVQVSGFSPNRGGGGPLVKQDAIFGMNTNEREQVVFDGTLVIVTFSSSAQNNNRGFRLSFRAIGEDFTRVKSWTDINTKDAEGSITHPSNGTRYPPYELSSFVIFKNQSQNGGAKLALTIDSYDVESFDDCSRDGLAVYIVDGGLISAQTLYCGTSNGPIALQSADAYIFVFYSDWSYSLYGFAVHWKLNTE